MGRSLNAFRLCRGLMKSSIRAAIVVALAVCGSSVADAQIPLGPEFRVDTEGRADNLYGQTRRSVAVARDGRFVTTRLRSTTTAAGGIDVLARRFAASGAGQG